MSIKGQGHSLTLVKGHSDFKVKCLTFGPYTQVSDSGPLGPLVSDPFIYILQNILYISDLFTYIMIVKYMKNKSLNQVFSSGIFAEMN